MPRRLSLLALLALAGCSELPSEHACGTVVQAAVEVVVRHAVTGQPLVDGATGTVTDGDYQDVLQAQHGECAGATCERLLRAAWERPGTYTVRVQHPGFAPFLAEGVEAKRGVCNVRTVRLTADLVPAS